MGCETGYVRFPKLGSACRFNGALTNDNKEETKATREEIRKACKAAFFEGVSEGNRGVSRSLPVVS